MSETLKDEVTRLLSEVGLPEPSKLLGKQFIFEGTIREDGEMTSTLLVSQITAINAHADHGEDGNIAALSLEFSIAATMYGLYPVDQLRVKIGDGVGHWSIWYQVTNDESYDIGVSHGTLTWA